VKTADVMLHRTILNAPDDLQVDHISGDGLDCRKRNLRLATHTENARNARKRVDNASGFKGVSWHKQRGKWVAQANVEGRRKHLGLFDTARDAHTAYVEAIKLAHGKFAREA
jgi:hypothetical protein